MLFLKESEIFKIKMKLVYLLIASQLLICCGHNETATGPTAGKDILEVTEHIKIDGLNGELTGVFKGSDVYEYIGITSNGVDCLYFPYKDGRFNIEFEVLTDEQKPFVSQLKAFAQKRGIPFEMTTYKNKEYYKTSVNDNVLRIEANTSIEKISALAKEIESKIFNNDDKTVYDVVPQ
jgi:hypothetical protein